MEISLSLRSEDAELGHASRDRRPGLVPVPLPVRGQLTASSRVLGSGAAPSVVPVCGCPSFHVTY